MIAVKTTKVNSVHLRTVSSQILYENDTFSTTNKANWIRHNAFILVVKWKSDSSTLQILENKPQKLIQLSGTAVISHTL